MSPVQFADEILERLRERDPRYHPKAYIFVLSSLHQVMGGLREPRHISGAELAHGLRDMAIKEFGPLARSVLGHWGIHRTEDVGALVFALVEAGVLVKEEDDQMGDFRALFDFEEVFEENYPWVADATGAED